MKTMRRWGGKGLLLAMLLLGLAAGLPVLAQTEGGGTPPEGEREGPGRHDRPGAEGEGSGGESRRERVRERMRLMRAWRLTEVIELDEAAAAQLFELLDAFDARIAADQETLEQARRELQAMLESAEGSDDNVAEHVELILSTHLHIEETRVQLVRDAGAFLTPRQQAALMLFLPQFDREMREMVREVRQERRERRGAHGEGSGRGE